MQRGVGAGFGSRFLERLFFSGEDLANGTVSPNMVIRGNYRVPEFAIGEDSVVNFPVPRGKNLALAMTITLRWGINENYALGNGEVQWQGDWEAIPNDASEVIGAATHSGSIQSGDINIPTNANSVRENSFTAIAAGDIALIDSVGLTLSRIALAGGANPVAEPYIVNAIVDYYSIFPKNV